MARLWPKRTEFWYAGKLLAICNRVAERRFVVTPPDGETFTLRSKAAVRRWCSDQLEEKT